MPAAQRQLLAFQAPSPQRAQALLAQLGEPVQELVERPVAEALRLREAIERLEGLRLALGENHGGARNPVGFFTVNQMTYDPFGAPRVGPFGAGGPWWRQPAEHALERARRAGEDFECRIQGELHLSPPRACAACRGTAPDRPGRASRSRSPACPPCGRRSRG